APRAPTALTGFIRAMDGGRPWRAVPLLAAAAGAAGPIEQELFDDILARIEDGLRAALPVDGVFLSLHGAATATVDVDPDGLLLARVRAIVGPEVPVIATLDLHANVSRAMVDQADMLIGFRTNPHVDMAERGAEAAAAMRAMLGGMRPRAGFVKLPMIPPATSQNTDDGPYADAIAYGQRCLDHEVMNVSVISGFSLGDTPKNGLSVIVTARTDAARAQAVAEDVARFVWSSRGRWVASLTSLPEAVRRAREATEEPGSRPLLLADVADNPGGGGRGNTVWILEALHKAGIGGVVLGMFYDPELAAEAHLLGPGARFSALFNRAETDRHSHAFAAEAQVLALSDGRITGRRGIYAGREVDLGPAALLGIGGLRVAVISNRRQLCEPAMLECLGVDLAAVRCLVVKSRGHFRAGFDECFAPDRILEVDVPGLTTVVLNRVPWRQVPRPIWPLDPDMAWTPGR
ncbi:M81 family metallopeptidase, partial [Neoroseomonas rubea]|uniref:M81 family metallopeptidase n=1 Tax=Neoroseomonas rubea TaxID=2748666 RepID=UPI0018DF7D3C